MRDFVREEADGKVLDGDPEQPGTGAPDFSGTHHPNGGLKKPW